VAVRDRINDHRYVGQGYEAGAYILQNGKRWRPADGPPAPPPVTFDDGGLETLLEERRAASKAAKPIPRPPDKWILGTVCKLFPESDVGFVQPDGLGKRHNLRFGLGGRCWELGASVRYITQAHPEFPDKLAVARIELLTKDKD
jgi:hypothetical protein